MKHVTISANWNSECNVDLLNRYCKCQNRFGLTGVDVELFRERSPAWDLKGRKQRGRGQRPWLPSAGGTPMPNLVLQLSKG